MKKYITILTAFLFVFVQQKTNAQMDNFAYAEKHEVNKENKWNSEEKYQPVYPIIKIIVCAVLLSLMFALMFSLPAALKDLNPLFAFMSGFVLCVISFYTIPLSMDLKPVYILDFLKNKYIIFVIQIALYILFWKIFLRFWIKTTNQHKLKSTG